MSQHHERLVALLALTVLAVGSSVSTAAIELPGRSPAVVLAEAGELHLLWIEPDGEAGRLRHVYGPPEGPFRASEPAATGLGASSPGAAFDRQGHLYAVWSDFGVDGERSLVRARRWTPTSRWTESQPISDTRTDASAPAVFGAAGRDVVAAWQQFAPDGSVQVVARVLGPAGGPPQVVTSHRYQADHVDVVQSGGGPWLVWDHVGDRGGIVAAPAIPGAQESVLSTFGGDPLAVLTERLEVVFVGDDDADGRPDSLYALSWAGSAVPPAPLRIASAPSVGLGASAQAFAADCHGRLHLVYTAGDEPDAARVSYLLGTAGEWEAPQALTTAGRHRDATLAVDEGGDTVVIAWTVDTEDPSVALQTLHPPSLGPCPPSD